MDRLITIIKTHHPITNTNCEETNRSLCLIKH